MEEGKEGERRTLYGSSLCCALAQLPVGLFESLLISSTRITGSVLLGDSLVAYGAWSHCGIHSGAETAIMELILQGPTWLLCGHPKGLF